MREQRGLLIGHDLETLKHTNTDFGLILVNQALGYPETKTEYIDIPFGDGSIDLTESLTGEIKYHNREGSFLFELVDHPFKRVEQLNEFANFAQGQRLVIIRPDEPNHFYMGRMNIVDPEEAVMVSRVNLSVVTDPYRYKKEITKIIEVVNGTKQVTLENSRMPVIPKITTTDTITIIDGAKRITVNAGTHQSLDFKLTQGERSITIEGNATVTFEYRQGEL